MIFGKINCFKVASLEHMIDWEQELMFCF